MDKNSKLRVGVIGAGFIGKVHLQQFRDQATCELAGVTDVSPALAQDAAARLGVAKVYDSAEELIDSAAIDAVVVAVPNRHHAPLAVRALEKGKHVLLEKPMALNGAGARAIVAAQRQRGDRVLMIAHQMRWEWLSQHVKQEIARGSLGRIYNAKAGMLRKKAIPGWGSWFTRKNESGGGPLIDLGVHVLDLTLWLMGNPKPVAVYGSTYAEFGPQRKGIGTWGTPQWDGVFDVEDLATALIKMEDGSTLSLDVSWAVNTDSDNAHFVHLMGNEGGVSVRGGSAKFVGQAFDRSFDIPVTPPQGTPNPRALLTGHFVDCVLNGKPPISDGISGLKNNLILDAIYESSATGKLVELDWTGIA